MEEKGRVRTLGPFERIGIWTQGCGRRCPGCISPDSRDPEGGTGWETEKVVRFIEKHPEAEGLTVSGGEPFLQAEALCGVIDAIRRQRELGVIIYTGYTLEELRSSGAPPFAEELLKRTDLLIDGPYVAALDDEASLRGSSNQRVIPLTERYRPYLALYGVPGERRLDVKWDGDGLFAVGIPNRAAAEEHMRERNEPSELEGVQH